MKDILTKAVLIIATLTLVACGSTTAVVTRGVLAGAAIFKNVVGSASEREVLCKYYNEHRTEIETVREYYKANWQSVPEADKPALLKINEQLNACDANAPTVAPPMRKTSARSLLDAFKRVVAIYRELKAAGVL